MDTHYIKNNSVLAWMAMDINFHHHSITLLPSGACYIHQSRALVIADLHLGKGVLLQEAGVPLVNQIDTDTIQKLHHDLQTFKPNICIICGDLVHAISPRMMNQLLWFEQQLESFSTRFILTLGNHDSNQLSRYFNLIECHESFELDDIHYSHYASNKVPTISGHIHPGIKIKKGRIQQYYKAFIMNNFNIICPAYGKHTGMFTKLNNNDDYFIIKHNRVEQYF